MNADEFHDEQEYQKFLKESENFRLIFVSFYLKEFIDSLAGLITSFQEFIDRDLDDFSLSFAINLDDYFKLELLLAIKTKVNLSALFTPYNPILFLSIFNINVPVNLKINHKDVIMRKTTSNEVQGFSASIKPGMKLPFLYLLHVLYYYVAKERRNFWRDQILSIFQIPLSTYKSYGPDTVKSKLGLRTFNGEFENDDSYNKDYFNQRKIILDIDDAIKEYETPRN